MTDTKRTRRKFPASFKLQVIEESKAEGVVMAQLAKTHGISDALLYNWRSIEKDIRKAAKQEKTTPPHAESNGSTNGVSNGVSHVEPAAAPAGVKSELRIIGLTPLIRELVVAELSRELPGLIQDAVSRELKKAFLR